MKKKITIIALLSGIGFCSLSYAQTDNPNSSTGDRDTIMMKIILKGDPVDIDNKKYTLCDSDHNNICHDNGELTIDKTVANPFVIRGCYTDDENNCLTGKQVCYYQFLIGPYIPEDNKLLCSGLTSASTTDICSFTNLNDIKYKDSDSYCIGSNGSYTTTININ